MPAMEFDHEIRNLLQRVAAAERLLDRRSPADRRLTAELRELFGDVEAFCDHFANLTEQPFLGRVAELLRRSATLKRRVDFAPV